jgi:hypothetical protein
MKRFLFIGFAIFFIAFGTNCHKVTNLNTMPQKGKEQSVILQLLQQIDSESNLGEVNFELAKEYFEKTNQFSNKYPEDPMAVEFLYRAGLIAMRAATVAENIENLDWYAQKALTIFDDIQMIYPDFSEVKNCIFNKCVIYNDILHDFVNAEIFHREYILRYPEDSLATQYIGKSIEELMIEIEIEQN